MILVTDILFFFIDPATTEIYTYRHTLSLHDALPIDSLVDWIDSDQAPGPAGAEDASYLVRDPAYRTGGALLAEVTELRAISGFDDAIYRRLRPYVCALPSAALSPINLNALDEDDAALLAMLTDGELTPEAVQRRSEELTS